MSAVQTYPIALDLQLPWQPDQEQEEAFKRTLRRLLIPLLLIFLIIPWLPVFEKEYEERELDIVKTKIILEPVIVEPEAPPIPEKPKPKPIAKPKPLQKEVAKPKKVQPVAKEKKKKNVAEEQGLTAISSQLSSLRQSLDLTKLQQKTVSRSQGGKIARADSSVIGQDQLTQKSEGIQVNDSLMKNENIALAAHQSTELDGFVLDGNPTSDGANFYSDLRGQRSDESIRRVLEASKSRTNLHYQRALRDNPGLAGTFIFQLVIEPDGSISQLKLVSSELNSPELEEKILSSIRQLNFGSQDVSPRSLNYKFNFLPS